jgi:Pectate lyase superfamily protein
MTILCDSATGIATTSPTDGQVFGDGTTSPISTSPLVTTQNGDYIFCGGIADGGSGIGNGPGFTLGARHSPFFNSMTQYAIQATAGSITPTITGTIAAGATLMCSAFKATPPVPTSTVFSSTINITNVQAANTEVIPVGADPTGVADSRVAIQAAITSAIAQKKAVYIPQGNYIVSCPGSSAPALTFPSHTVMIHGAGATENGYPSTVITITGGPCTNMQVGPGGSISSQDPAGWVQDLRFIGTAVPGSPTGFSCLQLNGIPALEVDRVSCDYQDIGFDAINNNYGAVFNSIRGGAGGTLNVGVYMRTGPQSGSDITFISPWVSGITCGMCMSGGGGGYHVFGGQLGARNTSPNDAAGSVILGWDYLTAATGSTSADFHGTSFEGTDYAWAFRAFDADYVETYNIAMNPSDGSHPALGVYKNTNFKNGHIDFHDSAISGHWAPQVGNALMVVSGVTLSPPFPAYPVLEDGTHVTGNEPVINGTSTWVDSVVNQSGSGVQQYATVHSSLGYQLQGGLLLNNASGTPEWSSNGGSTYTVAYTNPMTTLGDLNYGGASGAATRLAGNTTANDKVLVSTGLAQATPLTATCASLAGSGTISTCTWSSAPPTGAFVSCGAYASSTSATFTVADSASNSYTGYGSLTFGGAAMQGFYFPNIGAPITTVTLTASTTVSNLTLQCNAATNVATSSPADGTCTGTISSGTTMPCSSAITTSVAGDYLMCTGRDNNGGSALSAGSGFTLSSSVGVYAANQYGVKSVAGAITPSYGLSLSTSGLMVCGAFKPGSVASASAPTLSASPLLANPAFNQSAASQSGGTCSMSTSTSCTITLGHTYTTPVCIATQQSATLTGASVGCTVSGTTATITAAIANSETWGALVFGNPN